VVALDAQWREAVARFEELRAEQNAASKAIGRAKGSGDEAAAQAAVAAMQDVSARVKALGAEQAELERARDAVLATLENLGDPDAPDEDTVLRTVGGDEDSLPRGRDHLELAGALIDMEAGARVAGSRFAYLKGDLVFLEFALVRWALDKLAGRGFTPVVPPVLVREEALFGTGQIPGSEDQIYRLPDDDLYLVGTSEVPLAALHAGEVLDAVPLRYAGFSTCFRREAGAAGRDTRGIFRVHQFDKVEMFSFVDPSESAAEHERLLAIEEEVLGELGLPYRVVDIAVGDLGASAARKFDLEAWLPGQGRYRELTSCSNTTDFQARRLDIRFRPGGSGKPVHAHTLNGTCVAVGRTMIALLENGQREDGSVALPEVLRAYGAPAELRAATSA
jgi:seryl-tRNA synthetase